MEFFDQLKPFLGWLQAHTVLSLFLVFIISLFESLAFVGLLVPGSLLMTAAGILVGIKVLPVWPTLIAAILGAIAGDGLSYRIGLYFKDSIHNTWPFKRYPRFLLKGEEFFVAHGGKSVFLARFSPVRPVVPVIAGMMRMDPWRFFFSNVSSALLWAPAYIVPGIIIGMAALQFAPEVATRLVLFILSLLAVLCLSAWFLKIIFFKLLALGSKIMDNLWEAIKHSPKINPLYRLLQDPCRQQGHSQLNLLLGILIAGVCFIVVAAMVITQTGFCHWNIPVNQFFRNLYLPALQEIGISITYIGDRLVLAATVGAVVVFLFWRKQVSAACHWIAIVILSYGIVASSKFIFHSPRPPGLMGVLPGNSFPSGHTTITVAIVSFYAVVLERALPQKYRRWIYMACASLISLLILTRLYLGAHWLTDVMGGILAGWISAMLITLSYRCRKAPQFNLKAMNIVLLLALACSLSVKIAFNFKEDIETYTPFWPSRQLSVEQWWQENSSQALVYQTDRLGRIRGFMNVEWAADLDRIVDQMNDQNWEVLPHSAWINAVNHLANAKDKHRLSLLPPLYQGKVPTAVFIHPLNNKSGIVMVLRLWAANVRFTDAKTPLWYGALSYEKITRHPLKHSGLPLELPELGPPVQQLKAELKGQPLRQLSLDDLPLPKGILEQQWQGGILLLRSIEQPRRHD